ncbi:glycerate kinase [Vallitalea guaymasensis]|uniref:Glycerate kinase n=1 Tax=Vallitalea guaymasensis TaxID=1185412 RepID=A0A8J8M8E9_9FIRM|nr:glycerate kinase [Vallitalea guaymasensis]QUH28264.1 glycerate kinase [Vallitalea guaymasensis]
MKKIVIASDSFKGTMDSINVCNIVEKGIKNIRPEIKTITIPIADGGEGTVDAFLNAIGGIKVTKKVTGPLFDKIEATYGILDDGSAVIEMAQASGLPLVEGRENPLKTTTYGTGELIQDALEKGCSKIIIGIGGSATNDGGVGMAAALGVRFLQEDNSEIDLTGEGLGSLATIDTSNLNSKITDCQFIVACDVDNPLYGANGAAYVFAPQKGANAEMVKILDENLKHYAGIVNRDLGINLQKYKGSGAAGGLGAGLVAFVDAQLKSGINILLDAVDFDDLVADADLIITGEGKIDGQSLRGKVPVGIADRAVKYHKPVIAIVGAIGDETDALYERGISSIFSINQRPEAFEVAKNYSEENLLKTTESIIRLVSVV